jgi:hypothetical protein
MRRSLFVLGNQPAVAGNIGRKNPSDLADMTGQSNVPQPALVHRRGIELALDALEMIEPLNRAVEFRALFLGELGFHLGNLVGEPGPIQILDRGGDIGEHGETVLGHFGKTAEHDDPLMCAARPHSQDSRPDRGHDRRMSGEHAEIALDAGNVNLIDLTGEGELFGGDEIEVECGHGVVLRMASGEWRVVKGGNGS